MLLREIPLRRTGARPAAVLLPVFHPVSLVIILIMMIMNDDYDNDFVLQTQAGQRDAAGSAAAIAGEVRLADAAVAGGAVAGQAARVGRRRLRPVSGPPGAAAAAAGRLLRRPLRPPGALLGRRQTGTSASRDGVSLD